jgi:TonB family protein
MIGLFLALAAVADAPTPEIRQPTGKWVVDFDLAQCTATRNYGTAKDPLYLVLKQPPLGDVIQLALVQRHTNPDPEQLNGQVTFDAHHPSSVSVLAFRRTGSKLRSNLINLSSDQFAEAKLATTIRVKIGRTDERLALTDFGKLLKVMDECVVDLRKVWHAMPDGDSQLTQRAQADLQRLFDARDYPIQAARGGMSGTVAVVMLVDERGRVADCTFVGTSGAAVLDAQTCAILKERAKFTPAVGTDGKPAKDAFIQRITWLLRPR